MLILAALPLLVDKHFKAFINSDIEPEAEIPENETSAPAPESLACSDQPVLQPSAK